MTKIYVSGPMTGYDNLNFDAFNEAADFLREIGYDVVNPAEINPDLNADWFDCIIDDLQALRHCQAIYMLAGWEESYGALIEKLAADKMGMQVFEEGEPVYFVEKVH